MTKKYIIFKPSDHTLPVLKTITKETSKTFKANKWYVVKKTDQFILTNNENKHILYKLAITVFEEEKTIISDKIRNIQKIIREKTREEHDQINALRRELRTSWCDKIKKQHPEYLI